MLYTNMQITESSHGKFCSYSYLHTIRTTSILNPYSGVLSKHSIAVCVHNIVGVCTLHCDVQLYIHQRQKLMVEPTLQYYSNLISSLFDR